MGIQEKKDLPAFYVAADRVSMAGQRKYLRLFKIDLVVIIVGALFSAISIDQENVRFFSGMSLEQEEVQQVLLGLTALLMACGAIITLIIGLNSYKKQWHGGRAVAESIKSLAWGYMMRVNLSESGSPKDGKFSFDERFLTKVQEIVAQNKSVLKLFPEINIGNPQITEKMRQMRSESIAARKQFYLDHRLNNQIAWYKNKLVGNERKHRFWFWAVGSTQVLAFAAALVLILFPLFPLDATGVLSTCAASALAWVQVKQYEELAQAYKTTARELGLLAELLPNVESEERLAALILRAENVMAKEHALWLARRDQELVFDNTNRFG